ncbi:hypothetical protein ACH4E8_09795 [Streptomyces sp. NPDC017979]|uniref:hypothetical protein n=1 Tax=Streptomyces sp. NPDC017979 TaxID=3365024 RepID=UPI0037BA0975
MDGTRHGPGAWRRRGRPNGAIAVVVFALLSLGAGPALDSEKGAAPSHEPARVASDRNPGGSAAVLPVPPGATRELSRLQKRIAAHVAAGGGAYTFTSHLDRTTGRIVLESDAPQDVVIAVTGRRATASLPTPAVAPVQNRTVNQFHRRNDDSPFKGGAGIRAAGATGPCTAGFALRNGAGNVYSTSSASCSTTGARVSTESGVSSHGTVIFQQPAVDVAVIAGRPYGGRIYTGNPVSTTTIPVVSAGDALVGDSNHCYSGRTSGEVCGGQVVSVNGQFCGGQSCWGPLLVVRGGALPQPGDQGAPFYTKDAAGAHARGQVFASNGSLCFVTPWRRLSDALGLSIHTG